MGIFVGIGNYIGRVRQIGPNDYYIITEDGIAVLTERGKHILLDKYVTEDEIATWVKEHMVFWYDMSKPVDTYAENFNDWTKYAGTKCTVTNEILKANPYLQDHSGNNRPLKLNNFMFAAMSGVGGYDIASTNILPDRANVTVTDNRIIHITKKLSTTDSMVNIVPANSNPTHKFKITGLSDGRQVSLENRNGGFYTFDNGEHEVTLTYPEGTTSLYNAIGVTGSAGDMDVTIEFIPRYPNALVTDGVDDYGVVENLQQGVKMLFYTCNPFTLNKIFYDQTKTGWRKFNIYNQANKIAYNERNENGVTYIDGNLNSSLLANDLINKRQVITIINDGANESNTISPIYFAVNQYNGYFANMAFYNSIGFDAVPEGNVTLQRVIDYVINNILNKA